MKLFKYLSATLLLLPMQLMATEETVPAVAKPAAALSADPMSGNYLAQLVIGLFVVLLCILVLAWFAKKMNRFTSLADGSLKVIGGLSMGSRDRIALLQVGEKQLLIGISPGRISTLHVLDTPLEMVNNQSAATTGDNFLDKFKTLMADANKTSADKQDR